MGQERELNARQQGVLKIIVTSHIHYAEPVGSARVSSILDLSSATIRNVMGELEELGYLSKPHTSAGRIPTKKGYRYYVDRLIKPKRLTENQRIYIKQEYNRRMPLDEMLNNISHLLSVITRLAGIACLEEAHFFVEGASNMIDTPEFRDPKKIKNLIRLFDEKTELMKILKEDLNSGGTKVHIGKDESRDIMEDLSFITGSYRIGGCQKGSLGVVGPVRMDYSSLIPLVEFLSDTIDSIFTEMSP